MIQRVPLNITHSDKLLQYLIEVEDTTSVYSSMYSYHIYGEDIQFIRAFSPNVQQNINEFYLEDPVDNQTEYIPNIIGMLKLRIYLPLYSVESFYDDIISDGVDVSDLRYVLTAYTFIAGRKIILGSQYFDIQQTRAADKYLKFNSNIYPQMIEMSILDARDIVYSDDWKDFRVNVCQEPEFLNNTGSVLCFELSILDSTDNRVYTENQQFQSGFNSVNFNKSFRDSMYSQVAFNHDNRSVDVALHIPEVYEGDLKLYLEETYGASEEAIQAGLYNIVWSLVVKDEDNIYLYLNKAEDVNDYSDNESDIVCSFDYTSLQNALDEYRREVGIKDWTWFKEGLMIRGCIDIYENSEGRDDLSYQDMFSIINFMTDEKPLTRENFKFITPKSIDINKINLQQTDMIEYNVSAVNKVQHKVIRIDRPEDYKSNIIKPIFVRNFELNSIVIHPEVDEQISFNLNEYKSSVSMFYIRIEGVDFIEIGRTKNSVIFKIQGSKLPQEVEEGTFYILNQDLELVTTGKYTYAK